VRRRLPLLAAGLLWGLWCLAPGAPPAAAEPAPQRPALAPDDPEGCDPLSRIRASRWPEPLPGTLEEHRATYLRAKCLADAGAYREAEAALRAGLRSDPALSPFWELALVEVLLHSGRVMEAQGELARVLAAAPSAPVVTRVRDLLTGQAQADPEADAVFVLLATYFAHVDPQPEDNDLLLRLLALARERGELAWSRTVPLWLWRAPKDEEIAQTWARALRAGTGDGLRLPAEPDYVRRAEQLYRLRAFDLLTAELESAALPALGTESAGRLGQIYFRALLRQKAYDKALQQAESPAVQTRFGFTARDVLATTFRVRLRQGHGEAAAALLKELERAHPEAPELPRMYFRLARFYRNHSDMTPLQRWGRHVIATYPAQWEAGEAYWLIVWAHYLRGEHARAGEWCAQALAAGEGFSPFQRSRLLYWQGRIAQRLGRPEAAAAAWDELLRLRPSGYYGMLVRAARQEEGQLPQLATGPRAVALEVDQPRLAALWDVAPLRRATFLYAVEEASLAEAVLQQVMGQPLPARAVDELGALLAHFGEYHLQQRLVANYFLNDLRRSPVADEPRWRHAYPRAFWEQVEAETRRQQVDPLFALAVMREESHFNAQADSRAGAKGLMQLMPATAEMMARRARQPYDEAALLTPQGNIPLGVRYLKRVLRRFRGNIVHAAAAYNAGPGTVQRWVQRRGHLPTDEFVETIPYDETRRYVRRVFTSYLIYRDLYR